MIDDADIPFTLGFLQLASKKSRGSSLTSGEDQLQYNLATRPCAIYHQANIGRTRHGFNSRAGTIRHRGSYKTGGSLYFPENL